MPITVPGMAKVSMVTNSKAPSRESAGADQVGGQEPEGCGQRRRDRRRSEGRPERAPGRPVPAQPSSVTSTPKTAA